MDSSAHTNRLKNETSPYLLQHAHQPVDWYPWCDEALQKAIKEDKPIFLSIGYSACHWCHVMAHESFDDDETAALMNSLFVNIKVDREERPDIDSIYMKAIIALTGHGGWPMSVFLTPDQKPYFGGTYFPPAPKFNRPGFPQILKQAEEMYRGSKESLEAKANQLIQSFDTTENVSVQDFSTEALMDGAIDLLTERFDEKYGGFGNGMKFPEPMVYSLILRHWLKSERDACIQMVDKSLTQMAEGGMYDQVGGGFHRYSTDREWRVPHFEKMLYDNALLARVYLEAFQATKQELHQRIPEEIFEYTLREMTSTDGAFYSSQDADTGQGEGHYFTWELKEVLDILGPRHAKVFARAYGMTPAGNFERRNVLHIAMDFEKVAKTEDVAIFEVDHILKKGRQSLFDVREKRERPGTDEKIIAGWNGMMITAFAIASRVLENEKYRDTAVKCAEFLWQKLWDGKGLRRVYSGGEARFDACLEDYAHLMDSFVFLYEATFDLVWIERCQVLADTLIEQFLDQDRGGFFMTGSKHETLITRLKPGADEAVPSANAITAQALLKLGKLTGNETYTKHARGVIDAFRPELEKRPAAYTALLAAMDFDATSTTEIVISGSEDEPTYGELLNTVYQDFRPNKIVVGYPGADAEARVPLSIGRGAVQGKPTVYLCAKQTCHPPVDSADSLNRLLGRPPIIRLNIFDEEGAAKDMEKKEQEQFLGAMSQIFKHSGLGGGPK